jgi:hypothetical protein
MRVLRRPGRAAVPVSVSPSSHSRTGCTLGLGAGRAKHSDRKEAGGRPGIAIVSKEKARLRQFEFPLGGISRQGKPEGIGGRLGGDGSSSGRYIIQDLGFASVSCDHRRGRLPTLVYA